MQSYALAQSEPVRRIAPFVLLALVLHAAVLYGVRWPPAPLPNTPMQLNVMFEATEPANTSPRVSSPATAELNEYAKMTALPPSNLDASSANSHIPPPLIAQSWQDIVHEEAVKIEKSEVEREKLRQSTPLAQLQDALRQPHTETRLANGLLKITVPSGANICFLPPPEFARDMAGLYGISSTCP